MTRRSPAAQPAAPEAPAVHAGKSTARFVTIACKVAVARIELQLCREKTVSEQTQAGPRDIKQYFKTGPTYIVRGTAYPAGTPPKKFFKRPEMLDGAAITEDVVPADFWAEWIKQNKDSHLVRSGLLFAAETYDDIVDVARENEKVKCALSPLEMPDNDKDPVDTRVPRSVHGGVSDIAYSARG